MLFAFETPAIHAAESAGASRLPPARCARLTAGVEVT